MRDETLIDLDADPGAALHVDDRTGFGGWVDERFDDEPVAVDEAGPGRDEVDRRMVRRDRATHPDARRDARRGCRHRRRRTRRRTGRGPHVLVTGASWMPAVPTVPALTTTWFCPGVPATGAEGTAGDFVISNSTDGAVDARVTLLAGPGQDATQQVEVPALGRSTISAAATINAPFVGATSRSTAPAGLSSNARPTWRGRRSRHARRRRRRTGTSLRGSLPTRRRSRSC